MCKIKIFPCHANEQTWNFYRSNISRRSLAPLSLVLRAARINSYTRLLLACNCFIIAVRELKKKKCERICLDKFKLHLWRPAALQCSWEISQSVCNNEANFSIQGPIVGHNARHAVKDAGALPAIYFQESRLGRAISDHLARLITCSFNNLDRECNASISISGCGIKANFIMVAWFFRVEIISEE